jgi:hypothetical protein
MSQLGHGLTSRPRPHCVRCPSEFRKTQRAFGAVAKDADVTGSLGGGGSTRGGLSGKPRAWGMEAPIIDAMLRCWNSTA